MVIFSNNEFINNGDLILRSLIKEISDLLSDINNNQKVVEDKISSLLTLIYKNENLSQMIENFQDRKIKENYKTVQNFISFLNEIKEDFENKNYGDMKPKLEEISQIRIFEILQNYEIENSIQNTFIYQVIEEEFKCGIIEDEETKNLAISELKKVILLIVKDIKNTMRKEFNLEFFYHILKYNKYFKNNEEALIEKTLLIIKNHIQTSFLFKYVPQELMLDHSLYQYLVCMDEDFKHTKKNKIEEIDSISMQFTNIIGSHICFFYLSFFQILNFPLSKVSLGETSRHLFLRYKLEDNSFLNFETLFEIFKKDYRIFNRANIVPFLVDEDYRDGAPSYYERDRIPNILIKNKIYLNFLSENELRSHYFYDCAKSLCSLTKFRNHGKAKKYYEKAIKLNSKNPEFHICFGNLLSCFLKIQNQERALEHYEKAISLNPFNRFYDFYLAHFLFNSNSLKDWNRALKHMNRFVENYEKTKIDESLFIVPTPLEIAKHIIKTINNSKENNQTSSN